MSDIEENKNNIENENKKKESVFKPENPNKIKNSKKIKKRHEENKAKKYVIQDENQMNNSLSREENSKKQMNLKINDINKANDVIKYKRIIDSNKNISNKLPRHESSNSKNDEIKENKELEINCRQRLNRFLEINNRLFYIKFSICIISFLSFIYYVICTYINSLYTSLNYIDYFICTIYLIEHIINIILSHHFLTYIITLDSLISFLVEIPPFFVFLCKNYTIDYIYRTINMTRVLRLLKAYKLIELLQGDEKSVNTQIIYIIIILSTMIFIWTGIIQISDLGEVTRKLEITFETLSRRNLLLRRQFHHYLYFSLVSLTTVGYGEIVPFTVLGRMMIIFMVVVILVVVPEQTNEIINLSNAQTIYERRNYISSPDVPHIIILGDIELYSLKNFCKEFFHKDHGEGYRHIVILMNKAPSKDFELFLNQKINSKFIIYLQGDPMNNDDLLRADILNAKSCIIFTNKNSSDIYRGDHQSLLLAFFVKKFYYHNTLENFIDNNKLNLNETFLNQKNIKRKINSIFKKNKNNHFRICLQLNRQESCNYYYSTLQYNYRKNMLSDKLLVIESLKMNLLSKSCHTPGIISLISNLIISSQVDYNIFKKEPEWQREYKEGQQYEIYKFNFIEGELLFFNFQRLTQEIYNKFHSILIALEINYHGGTLVKLNPQSKETIIDLIYPYLTIKSKTNLGKEFYNNLDDQVNISLLDDYHQGSDYESEENNIKKYHFSLNKIRLSLYCISSGKDIIDGIKNLDEGKNIYNFHLDDNNNTKLNNNPNRSNINHLDSDYKSYSSKFKESKFSKYNKKRTNNFQLNKTINSNQNYSDSDSDLSDEIEGNEKSKYLIDTENKNIFDEYDTKNYYIMNENEKNYLYSNEIMRQGIKNRNDINHHIIICGMHNELLHFILPLRNKYIPEKLLKWIVILAPFLPQDIHELLCNFPKIIFIQGNPLLPENLIRANILTADIAVILSSSTRFDSNTKFEIGFNEIIGKENNNIIDESGNHHYKNNEINEDISDAKTLFIYKSIKKLNSSITIITELLKTSDIEFLLSSRNIKKLYKNAKELSQYIESNNQFQINSDKEDNNQENLHYEQTSIYAAGEVYLPSIIDKITAQTFYNPNLLTILNLLLNGEHNLEKKASKKLAEMIDIKGSNLFLIPCEPRNESFSDMFKRLLAKYNMISIALYRKNIQGNFYYVYTNPKKTTLIRETDMVFVLSGTENIISIYEKNFEGIDHFKNEEEPKNKDNKSNYSDNQTFIQILQDVVQQQTKEDINNIINNSQKKENINVTKKNSQDEIQNTSPKNIFKREQGKKNSTALISNKRVGVNFKNKKYVEIDRMQERLNKSLEILKIVNEKCKNIDNDIETFVKEEIINEIMIYLSKVNINK